MERRQNIDDLYAEIINLKKELEIGKISSNADNKIISSIGDAVIVADGKSVISYINPVAEKIIGLSVQEVVGKRWFQLVKLLDEKNNIVDVENDPVNQTLMDATITRRRHYLQTPTGQKLVVDIVVSPILQNDRVMGVVISLRDDSENNNLDITKTEFISTATHHLRTPLSTLKWYIEILGGKLGNATEAQKVFIDQILSATNKMITFVDALFNVSRVELGKFAIRPELADLKEVVQDALSKYNEQITTHRINLSVQTSESLSQIRIDRILTTKVLDYLIDNAIRYMDDGGKLTVTINDILPEGNKEPYVEIHISDTGYGISSAEQSLVFTKLFRGDNIEKKGIEGSGLSLYLVKSVLNDAGCSIHFVSEENKGSTFIVRIPMLGMKAREGTEDGLI